LVRDDEGEDAPLLEREILRITVNLLVPSAICAEESFIGSLGIPDVDGEVKEGAGGIPLELSTPKVGIAVEELDPGTRGPIGSLKAFLTSWLDFELPEDYKHRCPIFCSR
jgi:hypothetical protein